MLMLPKGLFSYSFVQVTMNLILMSYRVDQVIGNIRWPCTKVDSVRTPRGMTTPPSPRTLWWRSSGGARRRTTASKTVWKGAAGSHA